MNCYLAKRIVSHFVSFSILFAFTVTVPAAQRTELNNGIVNASFEDGRLVRLQDKEVETVLEFANERAAIVLGDETLSTASLQPKLRKRGDRLVCTYQVPGKQFQVIYELKAGWHFLSKQVVVTFPKGEQANVKRVLALEAELRNPIAHEHKLANGTRGVFLRFGSTNQSPKCSAFMVLQNPFLKWTNAAGHISMAYEPDLEWRADYGPFESDRACLGLIKLSGQEFPALNVREWKYFRQPDKAFEGKPMLDYAETLALSHCVQAFVMQPIKKSLRVHVPWCENDYQIDVGKPEGRTEYKRIIDQAAAVGCKNSLFTPENSAVCQRSENADAWGWENVLWLGLGPKIRKGEFDVKKDPIPPSIQEMLDYAKSKRIKMVAYAYPTLGFKQNPEWTKWCDGKTGGYVGVDTGVRSFQDWFVDQLVTFARRTGISGYCFDHWWIAYDKASSKYAQWYGCRRILQELRRRIPDIVIDGRQQYQWFGPWTWVGGSYPHPTTNDEQPGSFENFPDLHFSRVSGDRQRWAAWYYSMEQYTPVDLVPGYMTHQTPRNDAKDRCIRDYPFRTRDWDLLGWRYSVISSIATAPFNHVIDMIPARDPDEFKNFSAADQQWWRNWMNWTDQNMKYLWHLRPIAPPRLGAVDGTAAVLKDRGFVFLFNPNYRALAGSFKLDASIGLTTGNNFVLRELYPMKGKLYGKGASGLWNYGDTVKASIKGPQALVLEIVPASELKRPALLNAPGSVTLSRGRLVLQEVAGQPGDNTELAVLLPNERQVDVVTLNGREWNAFSQTRDLVVLPVTFSGTAFEHCQQIGAYDPEFTNSVFRADFTIPQRVFEQLRQRRKQWPIPYTEDDLVATWLGSDRLLLYVHIADPDDKWNLTMKINGEPIEVKKAYSAIYPVARERTFVGFYADISSLKPDVRYAVEVNLPELQPGQFQGLFFENVEAASTTEVQE